jgi:hypothetical protein
VSNSKTPLMANVPAIIALRPTVSNSDPRNKGPQKFPIARKKIEPDAFAGHLVEMGKDDALSHLGDLHRGVRRRIVRRLVAADGGAAQQLE